MNRYDLTLTIQNSNPHKNMTLKLVMVKLIDNLLVVSVIRAAYSYNNNVNTPSTYI